MFANSHALGFEHAEDDIAVAGIGYARRRANNLPDQARYRWYVEGYRAAVDIENERLYRGLEK